MRHTDIYNSTKQDTKARLQLLYGNALGGLAISLLCMAVFCFGFESPDYQNTKTVFFLVLVCSHIFRLIDNLYTKVQFKKDNFDVRAAATRFTIGIISNSCIWSMYSIMLTLHMLNTEILVTTIVLSALAGGATTIFAASRSLSVLYISSLILPFVMTGFFSQYSYFPLISSLGIGFWAVMVISSGHASKFVSETLALKNKNASLLELMDEEKKEVDRINQELWSANQQLDNNNHLLESKVEKRTAEIYRLSNLDPLTNLMNRTLF